MRLKFNAIHVLINNAGIIKANFLTGMLNVSYKRKTLLHVTLLYLYVLLESSKGEIQELFDLNVVATAIVMREAIKCMRDSKVRSHIIVLNR